MSNNVTRKFVLAGNAIFTVANSKNEHYTFKVTEKVFDEDTYRERTFYFASVLTGTDNTSDYTYLGKIEAETGKLLLTSASKYKKSSMPYRVLQWALLIIWTNTQVPESHSINHEGRCGRCGRKLTRPEGTDPEGYRYGFGPHCWKVINGGGVQ